MSSEDSWGWSCDGEGLHHRSQATAAAEYVFPDDYWGLMQICLESESNFEASASAMVCETILFAEDCAAAEFVPEPATLVLLGSGLAGLAGYAGLRSRTR